MSSAKAVIRPTGRATTPLRGRAVRLKASHPRGPNLGVIKSRYLVVGGYWVYVPSLLLDTVARPTDWELI